MSYWTIANGPGRDVAASGSGSVVLDALLDAGIPAPQAQRLVVALSEDYAARANLSALIAAALRGPSPQSQAARTDQDKVAAAEKEAKKDGEPALQVEGRAYIANNLNVGGDLAVNNVLAFNNVFVGRGLAARNGEFRTLVVPQAAAIGPGAFVVNAPLVANRPLVVRQGGQFSGQNTLDGQVNLNGQVVWAGRACNPAVVTLTKSVVADGSDKLVVGTQEVRVLTDHGDGQPDKIQFAYAPETQSVVQSVATEAITVITGATFDAENCAISTSSTQIYRVVSITAATVAGTTGQITITGGAT